MPETPDAVRVLLVDDDPLTRQALGSLLALDRGQPPIQVVGEVCDGDEVPAAVQALAPDVVLMDLGMRRVGGIEATRVLRAQGTSPHVIAVTTWDIDDEVARAVDAGAEGYVLKASAPQEAARAVRAVVAGEMPMSPAAVRSLVQRMQRISPDEDRRQEAVRLVSELTPAERDVIIMAAQGLTNQQIGARLHRSASTVKAQLSSAQQRMGVDNRTRAAVLAERAGIVP